MLIILGLPDCMYRKAEQKRKMDEEHCVAVKRVGSYPVVASALSQVTSLYDRAKEGNRLVKYTLESAESVTKKVSDTAVPIVTNRFEGKLDALNSIACSQLDKLEEKYPIITKPTEEVLGETKKVYDSTLKPTVDKVTAATKYGINTANSVKTFTRDTVADVTTYTCNKVKDAKEYTTSTVSSVKDYGIEKAIQAKDFSIRKIDDSLKTPLGQKVATRLDGAMDIIENYVDHYLPGDDEEKQDEGDEKVDTLTHVGLLSSKLRKRMFTRAMNDLTNIRTRSTETLSKLNFTVDLIQYARTNIDVAGHKLDGARQHFQDIFEEINRDECPEEDNGEISETDKTFERRAIRYARYLTIQLKQGLTAGQASAKALPETIAQTMEQARQYSEDLYTLFKLAKTEDMSNVFLENVRGTMSYLHNTLGDLTDLVVGTWPVNQLVINYDLDDLHILDDEEDAQQILNANGDVLMKDLAESTNN
ncbi:perilipin-2-like isoform X2 [Tubulanus polymorphus]|uniref:perilipin-2-like isoform X2 n=1 Tax=Tubulanus polymorphus TaxID=672921 RepID=UPI003DA41FBD